MALNRIIAISADVKKDFHKVIVLPRKQKLWKNWIIKIYFSGSSYLWYDKSPTYAQLGIKKKNLWCHFNKRPAYEICLQPRENVNKTEKAVLT